MNTPISPIRHPRETIASYLALDPGAGLHKIGFQSQYEIFAHVCRLARQDPIVIDSEDILTRPAATVRAYCARAGIGFRPDALSWPPGDRPEWEPSRRWHADVAASTGFAGVAVKPGANVEADPVLSSYLDYHLPFYEKLHAQRLAV